MILFSLFYSGPFDYVKFDVVVGLKESVLGAYLREECGKLTLFQSYIKAGSWIWCSNFFFFSFFFIFFLPSTVVQVGCYLMFPFLFNFVNGENKFFSIKLCVGWKYCIHCFYQKLCLLESNWNELLTVFYNKEDSRLFSVIYTMTMRSVTSNVILGLSFSSKL